jgi:arginase
VGPELLLLNPEWQGFGEGTAVYHDAVSLAETLFGPHDLVRIAVPRAEILETVDGVLGLVSIVRRCQQTLEELRAQSPSRIVMVGGTCGVEVAPVGYLNDHYNGDLGVVWFDAHGDLNTPVSSPSGHFHGMALRTLLGDGPEALVDLLPRPLEPRQVFLAGTRALDPPEESFVDDTTLSVTSPEDLATPELLVMRLEHAGVRRLYLHLDLDVLDPEAFPHSLMQTPEGVLPAELVATIRAVFAGFEVVGFSIVEFRARSDDAAHALGAMLAACGIRLGPEGGARLPT